MKVLTGLSGARKAAILALSLGRRGRAQHAAVPQRGRGRAVGPGRSRRSSPYSRRTAKRSSRSFTRRSAVPGPLPEGAQTRSDVCSTRRSAVTPRNRCTSG